MVSNSNNNYLTTSQFTLTLKSVVVGIDIMLVPNIIIPNSHQDAWISCLLGSLYPLYLVILAHFMSKKHPNNNILTLSKMCFGNFWGSILNYIFLCFFLFMSITELSGYSNVFRVYSVSFLKPYQVMLPCMLPIAYTAYKGIKAVGKVNEVGFYLTIGLICLPLAILPFGNILNLMPICGSGFKNILIGSTKTILPYSGLEIIFLIYPFLQNKKDVLKGGLIATCIVTSIYVLSVIAAIYYFGYETSLEFLWPILALTDSIHIPFINSFRYFFISFWSIVEFKCISTYYFAVSYGLNQSIKKISEQNFVLLLYPVIIVLSLFLKNPTIRRDYTNKLLPVFIIFNLMYISIICILIYIKKGDTYEKA